MEDKSKGTPQSEAIGSWETRWMEKDETGFALLSSIIASLTLHKPTLLERLTEVKLRAKSPVCVQLNCRTRSRRAFHAVAGQRQIELGSSFLAELSNSSEKDKPFSGRAGELHGRNSELR
ncbi:uncharacterized protein UMAG_02313 [Mycosarcoma maydis]|uniref:Uncharacterized protein n=1 Tax=Mycosarcoma maydis TaxID=5270 RepID=A0A0D1E0Q7_MYCMD|nr:uncharacterized protein UMAG_02313 [Ustilago maydis 521]KIS69789.1 hypothetical protein UMAG_02313 [Ustilago maydis 521]|eukprot:XP_011388634.1 hypothetical protein UMAG_02313 [Ustilago maydis 521]